MSIESLDKRLQSLSREVSPQKDLWPGIQQRISVVDQQPKRRLNAQHYGWLSLAAGVLLMVGVGRWFLPVDQIDNSPQLSPGSDVLIVNAQLEWEALEDALTLPESSPDLLITQLPQGGWRVVPTSTSEMAIRVWQPELLAGMRITQQAIADLREAISQQPQHTNLLRQLAQAERHQRRLLRQWASFNGSAIVGILPVSEINNIGDQNV